MTLICQRLFLSEIELMQGGGHDSLSFVPIGLFHIKNKGFATGQVHLKYLLTYTYFENFGNQFPFR